MTSKDTNAPDLTSMKLPELQAKYAEVTGKKTKSRKKADLIEKITAAMESAETAKKKAPAKKKPKTAEKAPEAASDAPESNGDADGDDGPQKASTLDVPALQARYRELVGRDTRSTNRRHLVWRVQEAEKGRIPTGPRARRGNAGPMKILPVRVPEAAVEPLAGAKGRLGLRSRNELFLKALHAYLAEKGEDEVAALFADDAA